MKGTSAAPEITGALNVVKGNFAFFGKDLQLTRGTVTFTGGSKIEPVLDVLSDYWVVAYASRYDGRIETAPTLAPGTEEPWKPGSPPC